mgnify:CR=1 FL=1
MHLYKSCSQVPESVKSVKASYECKREEVVDIDKEDKVITLFFHTNLKRNYVRYNLFDSNLMFLNQCQIFQMLTFVYSVKKLDMKTIK